MTGTASIINGRPAKKQLSEQLDRLDSIIDGLAEGLPEAVAAAAREGTRAAVKDAIVEIISNPDLRGFLQYATPMSSAPAESATPRPSLWTRIKAGVAAAKAAVVEQVFTVKTTVVRRYQQLAMVLPLKQIVVVTAVVGLVAGAVAYLAPASGISSTIAGIGGAVMAAAAQVGAWFRRSARTLLATQ